MNRKVFGYHPYWMGSAYLSYQWDLLTDLCFFSYEVNPHNGEPADLHGFISSPAVDSALANGTDVHLCVTLFSNHSLFLENMQSRQTLIDNLINLLTEKDAAGINIDFEAVSPSQKIPLNDFLIDLSQQLHQAVPGSKVSIAAPAVDWNSIYDIDLLNNYLDYFMIMGYDYYWNGSTYAGPVDGLYSMIPSYDYNLSRTLSWYQEQGADREKILLGLPYYARQWPTENSTAPSKVTGWGQAFTYYQIKNNASGYYSNEHKNWEASSFSPYYAFETERWNQCFVDDVYSMSKRFDLVNYRDIGGIGIWALGYDNGYNDFWNLIRDTFSDAALNMTSDTLYDSGGPYSNYYNSENYTITIFSGDTVKIILEFLSFETEEGFDSLFIYDGKDTLSPLMGSYSGSTLPGAILSSTPWLTLKFCSDDFTTAAGWSAIWRQEGLGEKIWDNHKKNSDNTVGIFPNPGNEYLTMHISGAVSGRITLEVFSAEVMKICKKDYSVTENIPFEITFHKSEVNIKKSGIYFIHIYNDRGFSSVKKWIHINASGSP